MHCKKGRRENKNAVYFLSWLVNSLRARNGKLEKDVGPESNIAELIGDLLYFWKEKEISCSRSW